MTTIPDADQIVDTHWPYDGPYGEDSVQSAAQAMAHLARYLNNATHPSKKSSLPYAASAYRVISQLASVAGLLPQALEQLQEFLERQADDPSLYDDRRDRPGRGTAVESVTTLRMARGAAELLARQLGIAARVTSHLGNDD